MAKAGLPELQCAPCGASLYPRRSREELGRRFLGRLTYLEGKPEGDKVAAAPTWAPYATGCSTWPLAWSATAGRSSCGCPQASSSSPRSCPDYGNYPAGPEHPRPTRPLTSSGDPAHRARHHPGASPSPPTETSKHHIDPEHFDTVNNDEAAPTRGSGVRANTITRRPATCTTWASSTADEVASTYRVMSSFCNSASSS